MNVHEIDVPKPQDLSMVSARQMAGLLQANIKQKKTDGGCVIAVDDHLFSRRNSVKNGKKICYDKKFPGLIKELKALQIPKPYFLQGEIFWRKNKRAKEERLKVAPLCNCTDTRAYINEKLGGVGPEITFFNVHEFGGHKLWGYDGCDYALRYEVLQEIFDENFDFYYEDEDIPEGNLHISRSLDFAGDSEEEKLTTAMEFVGKMGWEGIVINNLHAKTDLAFHADGQSPRPVGCYKWKPVYEADVIIVGWEYGTNSNKDVIGSLHGRQIRDGKEVGVGKVGGLNQKQKKEFMTFSWPRVARVKITDVLPTGSYRMTFLDWHDDKEPNECIGYHVVNL